MATTKKTAKKTSKKSPAKTAKYTKPKLREKVKKKVMAGAKGGRPGQWSARKAQIVATEYEKAGGDYAGEKAESQEHLSKWTKEKWHTKTGKKAGAKKSTARYLPDKAWAELSDTEKKATDTKKRTASRKGKQFVANTAKAKTAATRARTAQ